MFLFLEENKFFLHGIEIQIENQCERKNPNKRRTEHTFS